MTQEGKGRDDWNRSNNKQQLWEVNEIEDKSQQIEHILFDVL